MQTLPSFLITQCVTDLVQIRSQPCQVPGAGGQWPNQDGDCHGGFCHHCPLPIRQILHRNFPENNFGGYFLLNVEQFGGQQLLDE